ncbi:class A extended-spectrum beta-lactamase CIA-3 [Chryseobacterium indologenes]|uniref:beta-lactamase n=1 Tax=Chryseobacterium indologenes TaxID=253 RepID=G9MB50_CHRID|nr:extended-spectrum class A beta-lactamase CIA-3 [Chryseobacterium indologenes]ATN05727.1 class A extended-spectrum beta-lactamase CIA-3 [Chryseobacterium indologenes]AYY85515.1 class A extended-spectrum beta-lactamase CIA-3 [Chryseobacterium indologenes]QIX82413.1 class A extended-spectrum beta-lactamase CIA-3 [Chryseobacterium indologenes]TLX26488.1 class A extended-spectrum beta-lactamase CIA-3 [Chryseobacterium indologenes]UDQ52054.1 class A extended-spectrum beta-lactamase CIA-3 [Chryseo
MKKITFLLLMVSAFATAQKSVLDEKISAVIKDKKATVGVSVLGFENAFKYSKNGDEKLPLLSVFKFHLACAVLDMADKGKFSTYQKFLIKKSDLLENTWSPLREKFPEGNIELSLGEIITYTVAQSDNNTCDFLLRLIGGPQVVQHFMDSKGAKDLQIKYNEDDMHRDWKNQYGNESSTNATVSLLKKFYDGKLLTKKSTDFLMQIMLATTTGTNKIVEQLPKGTPVAHKTGSSGKPDNILTVAENDMGIITLPNGKHYAIAVFVSNSTETEKVNTRMVSDISKIVWDNFNK